MSLKPNKSLTTPHRKAAEKAPAGQAAPREPFWGENEYDRESAERAIGWLRGVEAGTHWGHPLG